MSVNQPLSEADDDLRFYTTAQVAELFQVTMETVRNWIDADKIKAVKIDNQYRIRRSDLLKFANEKYGPKE